MVLTLLGPRALIDDTLAPRGSNVTSRVLCLPSHFGDMFWLSSSLPPFPHCLWASFLKATAQKSQGLSPPNAAPHIHSQKPRELSGLSLSPSAVHHVFTCAESKSNSKYCLFCNFLFSFLRWWRDSVQRRSRIAACWPPWPQAGTDPKNSRQFTIFVNFSIVIFSK